MTITSDALGQCIFDIVRDAVREGLSGGVGTGESGHIGLSKSEAAALLGISSSALRGLIDRGRDGGLVTGPPKTRSSQRTVLLPQMAAAVLEGHRRNQPLRTIKRLVFPSSSGGYLQPSVARARFHRALEDAGIGRRRLHDLRHTTATLLLEDGEHMHVVRDLLGHKSVAVTLDTYGHVTAGMQRGAADRMGALMEGNNA